MNNFFNRQPRGIPVGGQFAATTHAEPELALSAGTPELGVRDNGDMFSAAKEILRDALQSHRDRIEARRAGRAPSSKPNTVKRRVAVAALVLAATVSLTACTGQGEECPSAADFPASSSSSSVEDSSLSALDVPMKGGGHGGGHSSGHGSSGHGSSGHSEGGIGGNTESGGSAGGSSGSSGPHFWPWTSSSHGNSCQAHPATSTAPAAP